jgi:hypothetical protein
MENANEIKISIPTPCHEDWNKMTPNEQGSFCGKCCKTVVDFTAKTIEEIKKTLAEQRDKKVCGRFMSNQLDETPSPVPFNISYQLLPKNISFNKAFGIALFFAFGTTLFSCTTTENRTVGIIAITDTTSIHHSPVDSISQHIGDTMIEPIKKTKEHTQSTINCQPLQGSVAIERIQGEIEVQKDTIKKKTIKDSIH